MAHVIHSCLRPRCVCVGKNALEKDPRAPRRGRKSKLRCGSFAREISRDLALSRDMLLPPPPPSGSTSHIFQFTHGHVARLDAAINGWRYVIYFCTCSPAVDCFEGFFFSFAINRLSKISIISYLLDAADVLFLLVFYLSEA